MDAKLGFEWVEPEPEWKIKLRELKERLEVGPTQDKETNDDE